MGLDIRLPIGGLFALLGAILVSYGAFGHPAQPASASTWNVNLWWGLLLLVFGVSFLVAGWRRPR